jgi:hypothetical protein
VINIYVCPWRCEFDKTASHLSKEKLIEFEKIVIQLYHLHSKCLHNVLGEFSVEILQYKGAHGVLAFCLAKDLFTFFSLRVVLTPYEQNLVCDFPAFPCIHF